MTNPIKESQKAGALRAIHEEGCRDLDEVKAHVKNAGLQDDPAAQQGIKRLQELLAP